MSTGYVLEGLDRLINFTLNPVKSTIDEPVISHLNEINELVIKEKIKVQSAITKAVFTLHDKTKIRCIINNYHSVLVDLLNQALKNKRLTQKEPPLRKLFSKIISTLEELLLLIESRYCIYLNRKGRVPPRSLSIIKKEVTSKISMLIKKNQQQHHFQSVLNIIRDELKVFFSIPLDQFSYTFQSIFYIMKLCRELEYLSPNEEPALFSQLDQLLISMNFNSPSYIQYLKAKIGDHINRIERLAERKEEWLFYRRQFKQFYHKRNMEFYLNSMCIKIQMDNWFMQKIFYLEKEIRYSKEAAGKPPKTEEKSMEKQKIRSNLSVDQMALILRAADDKRVIMAKSLSSVFKNIAPHLSTPHTTNISFDSMRSKSYSAELRDKEVAIQTLQQLIERIKEY